MTRLILLPLRFFAWIAQAALAGVVTACLILGWFMLPDDARQHTTNAVRDSVSNAIWDGLAWYSELHEVKSDPVDQPEANHEVATPNRVDAPFPSESIEPSGAHVPTEVRVRRSFERFTAIGEGR